MDWYVARMSVQVWAGCRSAGCPPAFSKAHFRKPGNLSNPIEQNWRLSRPAVSRTCTAGTQGTPLLAVRTACSRARVHEEAGFGRQKAEAAAAAPEKASIPGRGHLATRADLHKIAPAVVAIHAGVTFGLPMLLLPCRQSGPAVACLPPASPVRKPPGGCSSSGLDGPSRGRIVMSDTVTDQPYRHAYPSIPLPWEGAGIRGSP